MSTYPKNVIRLVDALKSLPGIGYKTALRLALHILHSPQREIEALAKAVIEIRQGLITCNTCFNLADTNPCPICSDSQRNHSLICVIESMKEVAIIEKTGEYHGVYHVLGGVISPLEGKTPDDLKIRELVQRVSREAVKEVILATNPDVEGEATAAYIAKLLKAYDVNVTRIARGIPVGGDIEFADEVTMMRALDGRQKISGV